MLHVIHFRNNLVQLYTTIILISLLFPFIYTYMTSIFIIIVIFASISTTTVTVIDCALDVYDKIINSTYSLYLVNISEYYLLLLLSIFYI